MNGSGEMLDNDISDRVPRDAGGAREIDFEIPERYNASQILFGNLEAGRGQKVAIYFAGGNATYDALCRAADRVGNALKASGLRRFSRVITMLDDTPAYPAAFFGAVKTGFVPVLINTLSPAGLVGYFLRDSQAEVAIVERDLCRHFTVEAIRGTRLRLVVVVDGPVPDHLPVDGTPWSEWLGARPAKLEPADTARDDMAFWMYSTGSTGRPKAIVHLQHDMAYTHAAYGARVLGIGETDICFSPPKIFFAYGFGNSITFPFSVGDSAVLYPGRPEPEAVFDCIERFRPTLLFGLPTLYNALVNHPRARNAELSSIRLCLSAAETLSAELFGAWKDRFGFEIVEGLGSTELLHIYLSNRAENKKLGSAGIRVPGYEFRLLGDNGDPVSPGQPGLLSVRGDSSAPCYWNKPDKTAETMRAGWIHTGDRFRLDADGFYFFQGRADDLIKVSGQWVYPQEIELCLADHPAVRECAVMGVKMANQLMTTKAFVVLVEGATAGEEMSRALRDFVKDRLLPYKYPRIVAYRERLPKTGTGKIDRQKLLDGDNTRATETGP